MEADLVGSRSVLVGREGGDANLEAVLRRFREGQIDSPR